MIVAVIDSGVDLTHPAFAGRLWINRREIARNGIDDDHDGIIDDVHGADMITGSGLPADTAGHGSLVAGVISSSAFPAEGDPGGIAPAAKLMILKVMQPDGTIDLSAATRAVLYAVAHKAKIINMSWGGRFDAPALEQALARASAAGVLLVAAAGNEGGDLTNFFPADYPLPTMISVAATCRDPSSLADFSDYDKLAIDIAAPGCSITGPGMQNGSFWTSEGTSFAAPEVAATAALLSTQARWAAVIVGHAARMFSSSSCQRRSCALDVEGSSTGLSRRYAGRLMRRRSSVVGLRGR